MLCIPHNTLGNTLIPSGPNSPIRPLSASRLAANQNHSQGKGGVEGRSPLTVLDLSQVALGDIGFYALAQVKIWFNIYCLFDFLYFVFIFHYILQALEELPSLREIRLRSTCQPRRWTAKRSVFVTLYTQSML